MPYPHRDDLALALLVAGLVAAFATLALVVGSTPEPLDIDQTIVALVVPWRGSPADLPMKVATYCCSWQVIVGSTAVAAIVFVARRWHRSAALILVAVVGDEIIVSTLKWLIQRPRPDQSLAMLPATGSSFPSGHTFICVAFYGLLAGLALRRMPSLAPRLVLGVAAVAWALTVGFSRVYLGAHWPTDVLGSLLLGSALVVTLLRFDRPRPITHGAPGPAKPPVADLP